MVFFLNFGISTQTLNTAHLSNKVLISQPNKLAKLFSFTVDNLEDDRSVQ